MPSYEDILERFKAYGQEHVLAGWEKLFLDQQDELLRDCARVDFAWLSRRWEEAQTAQSFGVQGVDSLEPPEVLRLPADEHERLLAGEARAAGEEALRAGRLAVVLAAGGRAERFGLKGAFGCFPVGPLSRRSLFQWQAERVLASSRRYGAAIPLYVMTSGANDREVRQFFEENGHFGLRPGDVSFFMQEMAPGLDMAGKLMLATPSTLVMHPNGHGGFLPGLKNAGLFGAMKERGIDFLSFIQVDNPLALPADPLFLGWHMKSDAEMSAKVVEKTSPAERVGVAAVRKGAPIIVEHSEIDGDAVRETDDAGKLRLWAGSIGAYILNREFAAVLADAARPRWHQSRRKTVNFSANRLVKPEKENSIRFETFAFDALRASAKSLYLEVRREEEFAPLKNAEGSDSVDSARGLLSNHFCDWLAESGVSVPAAGMGEGAGKGAVVEISPLYALDAEELREKISPDGLKLEKYLLLG